jgi:hypothetical protein
MTAHRSVEALQDDPPILAREQIMATGQELRVREDGGRTAEHLLRALRLPGAASVVRRHDDQALGAWRTSHPYAVGARPVVGAGERGVADLEELVSQYPDG